MKVINDEKAVLSLAEAAAWEKEQLYWECFDNADRDTYVNLWHNDFFGWPHFFEAPCGKAEVEKLWDHMMSVISPGTFNITIDKPAVRERENLVIICYNYHSSFVATAGASVETDGRMFHTWIGKDDDWAIIHGSNFVINENITQLETRENAEHR